MAGKDDVKALVFDVFGTVVDWRASCVRELSAFGRGRGITAVDWAAFADDWRGLYQPSMEEVRSGRRGYVTLDQLHGESLATLLQQYGVQKLADHEIEHLVTIWHRLAPWPDSVEGLYRLKRCYILGTLSNGNIGLMTRLAKHGGLPWDAILGAEIAQNYKPVAEVYLRSVAALTLEPHECMMVAAHNGDLAAARELGLRTAFILRPTEHGPGQTTDTAASHAWDIVTDSFHGLADALGCPRF